MDAISSYGAFLAHIWSVFTQTNVPGFGITFGDLYLGAFVVLLSIRIFHSFLRSDHQSSNKGGKS